MEEELLNLIQKRKRELFDLIEKHLKTLDKEL